MLVALFASMMLCHVAQSRVVVVTGATGRTGTLTYLALKKQGLTVRAFVRNATKAKQVLACDKCDESEGIFVGDISQPGTMTAAMTGADELVITTGPAYKCQIPSIFIGCKYLKDAEPKTISWLGVKAQVTAFASSPGPKLKQRKVTLLSNALTTVPNNYLDKIDNGHGCFYPLQGEAFLMSSGVQFTVLKANGLGDGDAAQHEILVGHDDQGWSESNLNDAFIARADIANLLAYSASNPDKTDGLRFDVTSKKYFGKPTTDVSTVFDAARYPWDPRKATATIVV